MRITGLSNQWGKRLFEHFRPDEDVDYKVKLREEAILEFLRYLTTIDGPDLWVGTSHSLLNFCARDTGDPFERIPSLADFESLPTYRISYPVPREFRTWPHSQVVAHAGSVEEAAELLLVAIASSDANPERYSAQWNWFVCPHCDFHSSCYSKQCQRCAFEFPRESLAMALGMYRTPKLPDGATVPCRAE